MTIAIQCSQCGRKINANDSLAGKRVACPGCKSPLEIPHPNAAAGLTPLPDAASGLKPLPNAGSGLTPLPSAASGLKPLPSAVPHQQVQSAAAHHDHYDDDHDEEDQPAPSLITRQEEHSEDLIDMTPMVDIVFFLLIFFLTTSMTAVQAVMDLPNPQKAGSTGAAAAATSTSENDKITITIQEDDTFWIDGEQHFSVRDIRSRIRRAKDETGGTISVVVVGNANASHGSAIRCFDAASSAGVASISLMVKEETD
jgi:biopolymer transport protein ExbD